MTAVSTTEPTPEIATTSQAWRDAMDRLQVRDKPGFFKLRARLPVQGRTNQVVAASPHVNVVLKTYASGGENELHAHTNEDHLFVVLQGRATFHGPRGESRVVGRHEGVVLPRGVVYRFIADEEEPLVLLRVGAVIDLASDPLARVDADGAPFDGYSEGNREVPCILSEDRWFG